MTERYVVNQIREDLARKMVFVGGPRQVGKTTMAKSFLANKTGYLSWDIEEHREQILLRQLPPTSMWVFDELHKYRRWRNYLKGLYDAHGAQQKILVTGSARLEHFRFGGDSLQGRYHCFRLHPLSVAELGASRRDALESLLRLSGFPEPLFSSSEVQARRWSREYRIRLVREEITSLENVSDLGQMELLLMRLPDLVGSPLSLNALREDLQVSHKTVARWVQILENLYAIFRISPFGAPKIRAVKKEQKHYHYDWAVVPELSLRFENLVASHLLKWVHWQQDAYGRELELRYFRDVDGREVDFVVLENRKPISFVETKWKDTEVSSGLRYLVQRFPKVEAWQISALGSKNAITSEGIRLCPAYDFLSKLV